MLPCLEIFVLGSLPHFYLAEPSILETMEGMSPKEHLHKSGIYFDLACELNCRYIVEYSLKFNFIFKLTGVPIQTMERYQISFLVQRISEYKIFSSIAGDIYIPGRPV